MSAPLVPTAFFTKTQSFSVTLDGVTYSVSAVLLPNGAAAPFTPLQGSIETLLFLGLLDIGKFANGSPVSIALPILGHWYGITFVAQQPTAKAPHHPYTSEYAPPSPKVNPEEAPVDVQHVNPEEA